MRVMVETNSNLAPFTGSGLQGGMMADVDAAARAGEVVSSLHEAAQSATLTEPEAPAKPEKVPLHQRLFRREEKAQIVPAPPETPEETPDGTNSPEMPAAMPDSPEAALQPETQSSEEEV